MADSDYIIYVDESGDHSLISIGPHYPIFVIVFVIIEKSVYPQIIAHALSLKFDIFGHDMTVLHEREIRKRLNEFSFINSDKLRGARFMAGLTDFVAGAQATLIAAIIDKQKLIKQYVFPDNPYEIALKFCLERAFGFLKDKGQHLRTTYVVVESRGSKEDNSLELSFRRTCGGDNIWNSTLHFAVRFSHKMCNSTGMQLADLVARPIGQEFLTQARNSAFTTLLSQNFGEVRTARLEVTD